MPLPKSISFSQLVLPSGFQTEGVVKTLTRIKAPDGAMVGPVSGSRFVCLDDPFDVDAFRFRLRPGAAKNLVGLTVLPRSGVRTMAADGAKLIFKDATLKQGQRFQFAWNFMTWGDMPWNDFALFEAKPDSAGVYGISIVLSDLEELAHTNKRTTGWRTAAWTAASDFTGALEWTVANGQEITNPAMTQPDSVAFTNPAALLIDAIRVFG